MAQTITKEQLEKVQQAIELLNASGLPYVLLDITDIHERVKDTHGETLTDEEALEVLHNVNTEYLLEKRDEEIDEAYDQWVNPETED